MKDPKLIEREEKPREFTIYDSQGEGLKAIQRSGTPIHPINDVPEVVEKSALTALEHKLEVAMETLAFYANRKHYEDHSVNISVPGNRKRTCSIEDDGGRRARRLLENK